LTLHRCIDVSRDPCKTYLDAHALGFDTVLTSGAAGSCLQGMETIGRLLQLRDAYQGPEVLVGAGVNASGIMAEGAEKIITKGDISAFAAAGADMILLPAPGTVPGITVDYVRELVQYAHSLGCLTITAIGTSQEGADTATIRQIALMCKMTGTDIHHLGDAGYGSMALPENIQAYSIAIRGIRHTYRRMAGSVNR